MTLSRRSEQAERPSLIGLDQNFQITSLGKPFLLFIAWGVGTNTPPAEHMDETIEVRLSAPDIPYAYDTVLCAGCRAGDRVSRESVDIGFCRFNVFNKRGIRKEITYFTGECYWTTLTVVIASCGC
jgi:hypothetical protein